jgi:orc1/cdc6 family replication initiation protein
MILQRVVVAAHTTRWRRTHIRTSVETGSIGNDPLPLISRASYLPAVITNARVLQADFVPADVEHRHEEINRLSAALDPLLDGDPAENAFLFGPTGVGKTCVSRFTLQQLQRKLLDVRVQHVNCWQDHTRFRLLYRLLDGIDRTVDIHRRSTPHDLLLERLREADDHPYVVVLDEVDQLADKRVLYDLERLPHLTMVCIANREADLFAGLDERVRSRLSGGPHIQFDRYTLAELTAILRDRVDEGFEPGAVPEGLLADIADGAAGDARVGIHALRTAAREAEAAGRDHLTEADVETAVPQARSAIRQRTVDSLTDHQRVLYEEVQAADGIAPRDLYERYRERVDDPKSERTLRSYLSKMTQYNLLRAEGQKRGRRYFPVDAGDG